MTWESRLKNEYLRFFAADKAWSEKWKIFYIIKYYKIKYPSIQKVFIYFIFIVFLLSFLFIFKKGVYRTQRFDLIFLFANSLKSYQKNKWSCIYILNYFFSKNRCTMKKKCKNCAFSFKYSHFKSNY